MIPRGPQARPAAPLQAPPERAEDVCEVRFVDETKVRALRAAMKPEGVVRDLAETFRILGDSTRVKILYALSRTELCVCDLARLFGLSESAVSHHLRLLRARKLVRFRKAGKFAYYSLADQHIETLFAQGLRHVEE
ncbi:MAG: ArsR/SmtB family transcription factor [Nitrospinota bacterium]